jgi:hypothetical protein
MIADLVEENEIMEKNIEKLNFTMKNQVSEY